MIFAITQSWIKLNKITVSITGIQKKQDERNKTRQKRNDELFRIFDNNELPNVIITGLDGEDDF